MPTQPAETFTVIRPISYIRVAVFTALSIFVTVAVGVGVFFGREAGLLTFSLAMLVAGAYHINNLFKLVRWMRTPSEESAPLPRALGMGLRLRRRQSPLAARLPQAGTPVGGPRALP